MLSANVFLWCKISDLGFYDNGWYNLALHLSSEVYLESFHYYSGYVFQTADEYVCCDCSIRVRLGLAAGILCIKRRIGILMSASSWNPDICIHCHLESCTISLLLSVE